MIDGIKAEILNPDIYDIKFNRGLLFHGRYNSYTGEANEFKLMAYHEGLQFTIVDSRRVFIQGSLPKYFLGNNYENLTHQRLLSLLNKLEQEFGIKPQDIVLQNLEFGLSVDIGDLNPKTFLESEVIDYKVTTKEINTHNGKGYTISFPLKNYIVKLYDKGMQYSMDGNVLRFEIRVKKMTHLKKTEIKTLEDLMDINKWKNLKGMLIKTFKEILICKYQGGYSFTEEEVSLYRKGSNQQFWLKHWPDSKTYENGSSDPEYIDFRKRYYKLRADFKKLITDYRFDTNKRIILNKISGELDRLIAE